MLLHELAHIRRGDAATQMLASAALCAYWWNPLAWIGWRRFVVERECAADDLVLSAGAGASAYASHLLDIAKQMQIPAPVGPAALAFARRSQIEGRLAAILNPRIARSGAGKASAGMLMLVAVVLSAPLAGGRAQDSVPLRKIQRARRRIPLLSSARQKPRRRDGITIRLAISSSPRSRFARESSAAIARNTLAG